MSIFYTREENEKEVKIVFTLLAVRMYLVVGLLLAMLFLTNESTPGLSFTILLLPFVFLAFFIVVFTFLIAYWKPMREIRSALKKGKITISGSRWSLQNPRTIVIPKL